MENKEKITMIKRLSKSDALNIYCKGCLKEVLKDLEQKQKQDKILKIIKDKNVDIKQLKHFIQCYTKEVSLKTYNDYHSKEELTQEEYDLLEEWLDNE